MEQNKKLGIPSSQEGGFPKSLFDDDKVSNSDNDIQISGSLEGIISLNAEESLSIHGLHSDIQTYISSLCEAYRVPVEFVLAPVLGVASVSIGSKVKVKWDQYENNLNLFSFIVANSGDQKSAPCKQVMKPIKDINRNLYAQYLLDKEEAMARYENDPDRKKKDKPDLAKIPTKQVLIQDSTPEARYKALKDNPHGLLLYADELNGIFDNMGRYTKNGEKSELLSTYDGEDIIINRKGQGAEIIENPFLSMLGGIQPEVLKRAFNSPEFMDSGFMPRVSLFYPMEYKESYYQHSKVEVNNMYWDRVVRNLYSLLPSMNLLLDPEASKLYIEFYNYIVRKRSESASSYEKSALAKLRINVFKVAGIIHCINCAVSGVYTSTEISAKEMGCAIDIMIYLGNSQKRIASLIRGGGQPESTVKPEPTKPEVVKWLKKHAKLSAQEIADITGFSIRHVKRIK